MRRDTAVAKDLRDVTESVSSWYDKVDGFASQAFEDGALAHRNLYEAAATQLMVAQVALARAAQIIDPEQTDVEDYE